MDRQLISIEMEEPLLKRLDRLAAEVCTSRDQLVVDAIHRHIKQLERELLDREFEAMGRDEAYQQLMLELAP
jgi:metal-responsive CopG/Arc/MetJ family transcriptional regulator